MRVEYAILADAATLTHDGKLVLVGGDIDSVTVHELPALVQLFLAVRLVADAGDDKDEHTYGLECVGPAGKKTVVAESMPLAPVRPQEPGKPYAARLILDMKIVAGDPGQHLIHIFADGQDVKTVLFDVKVAPEPG